MPNKHFPIMPMEQNEKSGFRQQHIDEEANSSIFSLLALRRPAQPFELHFSREKITAC